MNTQALFLDPAAKGPQTPATASRNDGGSTFQDVLTGVQSPAVTRSPTGSDPAAAAPSTAAAAPQQSHTVPPGKPAQPAETAALTGQVAQPANTEDATAPATEAAAPAPIAADAATVAAIPAPMTASAMALAGLASPASPATAPTAGVGQVSHPAKAVKAASSSTSDDPGSAVTTAALPQASILSLAAVIPPVSVPTGAAGPVGATVPSGQTGAGGTQAAGAAAKAAVLRAGDPAGGLATAAVQPAPGAMEQTHGAKPPVDLPASLAQTSAVAIDPAASLASLPGAASLLGPAPVAAAPHEAAASAGAAAAPAAQLTPALVQIANTAGSNHITIRLDPLELGSVDVRIDRAPDGAASVQVTVERPETLRLLLNDQPQLQRALDAAGLPQDGRTVTLSLATPDPTASSTGGAPTMASGGGNTGGGHAGGGNANSGQASGGDAGGQSHGRPEARYAQSAATISQDSALSPGWLRAGIDITA